MDVVRQGGGPQKLCVLSAVIDDHRRIIWLETPRLGEKLAVYLVVRAEDGYAKRFKTNLGTGATLLGMQGDNRILAADLVMDWMHPEVAAEIHLIELDEVRISISRIATTCTESNSNLVLDKVGDVLFVGNITSVREGKAPVFRWRLSNQSVTQIATIGSSGKDCDHTIAIGPSSQRLIVVPKEDPDNHIQVVDLAGGQEEMRRPLFRQGGLYKPIAARAAMAAGPSSAQPTTECRHIVNIMQMDECHLLARIRCETGVKQWSCVAIVDLQANEIVPLMQVEHLKLLVVSGPTILCVDRALRSLIQLTTNISA